MQLRHPRGVARHALRRWREAGDPSTSPARLAVLAALGAGPRFAGPPPRLLGRVAQNPNLSRETLYSIGERFPAAVLMNPIWMLLSLEGAVAWPESLLRAFLRLPEVPLFVLAVAVRSDSPWITGRVVYDPRVSPAGTEELARAGSLSLEFVLALVRHPHVTAGALTTLARRLSALSSSVFQRSELLGALLSHGALPGGALAILLRHGADVVVQARAARQAGAPPEALAALLAAREPRLRQAVAESPGADEALLRRLLLDAAVEVRQAAARHPRAPRSWLDTLRRAGACADLSGFSAPDRALAPEVLVALAAEEGEFGRVLAARHPDTPPGALAELLCDPSREVRLGLAANPGCPPALLARLANQRIPELAQVLARNPATPEPLLSSFLEGGPALRQALAENAACPPALVSRLGRASSVALRRLVAQHPNAPEALVLALSRDKDPGVRVLVAARAQLPSEIRARLLLDPAPEVRRRASSRKDG